MKHAIIACVGALALAAGSAEAGPEDGTLNLAFTDPIEGVDPIFDPKQETDFLASAVFNRLIAYDADSRSYYGELAEDFRQIDPLTWEFDLRSGITFHDGSAFDAEDVAYTINFIADPDQRYRLRTRFTFMQGAEVVDADTVRIHLVEPYAPALARLATSLPIFPSDAHGALEDPSTWGQVAVGTGPYRLLSLDASDGIVLERYEDYAVGAAPEIETIRIRPIPDAQSQLAELMVGNLDAIRVHNADMVMMAGANPDVEVTTYQSLNFLYLLLDASGESGAEQLTDPLVRQAIFHAIDRGAIQQAIVAGGGEVEQIDRICFPSQVACPEGGEVPSFDPDLARDLLAEAGFADGFPIEITTIGPVRHIAEAVAGYLRDVGIVASVDTQSMGGYRQRQQDGEIQILVQEYTHGGLPDAGYALSFYYGSPTRNSSGDPRMGEIARSANSEADAEAREELVREGYDRMVETGLILPISASPAVFLHSSAVTLDLETEALLMNPYGASALTFAWAD